MTTLRATAIALLALAMIEPPARAEGPAAAGVGESIYVRGVLSSGQPLEGRREAGGASATGAAAACVNCHQHSGLGSKEGNTTIPPVTGEYLFARREHADHGDALAYVESMHGDREPYTEATLARAIRDGVDSQGRALSVLMPRYALGDGDMAALIEYLRKLTVHRVPGVTESTLHFATIFTSDVDRRTRDGVLDVLQHFVTDKNAVPFGPSPTMNTSGKTAYAKSMYMAHRRWQLHVWDLAGPSSSWAAQLDKRMSDEPVYAVLSGVGGPNWAPVHEFCEKHGVPCLFPHVEVPVVANGDFYPIYFSRGVLLEADLIAASLERAGADLSAAKIVQVYRAGDSGEKAAEALAAQLVPHGARVRQVAVPATADARAVAKVAATAGEDTVLVLWLRPRDLAALGPAPAARVAVYISGLLGGLEDAPLPADWRARTRIAFPLDLPDKRGARLDYPLGWFRFRHIPLVAQQAQVDTYLACSLVADALNNHMADVTAPPYLVEQIQSMLERRIITGYYPHLTLATNQRFASKGGYIAHFAASTGSRLVADSDWVVP